MCTDAGHDIPVEISDDCLLKQCLLKQCMAFRLFFQGQLGCNVRETLTAVRSPLERPSF